MFGHVDDNLICYVYENIWTLHQYVKYAEIGQASKLAPFYINSSLYNLLECEIGKAFQAITSIFFVSAHE